MNKDNCKRCGNNTFFEGKLSNYTTVQPINKVIASGSKITVSFCSKCGEVSSMRVDNPEKFDN